MGDDLYYKLRKHLDKQLAGPPETQSDAEINILKRFYTPEQTKIVLKMTNIPKPAVKFVKVFTITLICNSEPSAIRCSMPLRTVKQNVDFCFCKYNTTY